MHIGGCPSKPGHMVTQPRHAVRIRGETVITEAESQGPHLSPMQGLFLPLLPSPTLGAADSPGLLLLGGHGNPPGLSRVAHSPLREIVSGVAGAAVAAAGCLALPKESHPN